MSVSEAVIGEFNINAFSYSCRIIFILKGWL